MGALVQRLFDGPIDVVGDVHGEIDALRALIAALGYTHDGREHPGGRRLVFLGDLCDRGPDSPAVIELVQALVDGGRGQCILGNHELNSLRFDAKEGSGWILPPAGADAQARERAYLSTIASGDQRVRFLAFFQRLPIALERDDLRLVHAAWDAAAIATVRASTATNIATFEHHEAATQAELAQLRALARPEQEPHAHAMHDKLYAMPMLAQVGLYDENKQTLNPVRRLTSGPERRTARPFFASGKWRFSDRVTWWDEYSDDIPVIVGHYWRGNRNSPHLSGGKPDLFVGHEHGDWLGPKRNVYCVDFSVGGRHVERRQGGGSAAQPFLSKLGAVRWPERTVMFDDGSTLDQS